MTATTLSPSRNAGAPSLRPLLLIDAATCLAMGAALLAWSAPLAALLALPQPLLWWAGLLLLPCAALMALAAVTQNRALAWLVVAGNGAWVLASLLLLLWVQPNGFGLVFVLVQAAAVATLMGLEKRALG